MRQHIALVSAVVVWMGTLVACGPAEQEPEPAAPIAEEPAAPPAEPSAERTNGPDPTVTDPDHYTVDFENDHVRVLRIQYGPGEASEMHDHPASVAVFLTPLLGQMTLPDGSTQEMQGEPGQVLWAPAGQHQPANAGDEGFELVQIELKDGADEGEATEMTNEEAGPDPTVTDPDHYTVDFENDRVRVLRIQYGPGEASEMHDHPASVAVFLTPLLGQMTLPDGSTQEMRGEPGQVLWAPAGQHQPANTGDEGFELVQIELK